MYSNGTYGKCDYTVRERNDGTGYKDVYIHSDSERLHSHDVIDNDGNIVASYHDYLLYLKELIRECEVEELLSKNESKELSLSLTKNVTKR